MRTGLHEDLHLVSAANCVSAFLNDGSGCRRGRFGRKARLARNIDRVSWHFAPATEEARSDVMSHSWRQSLSVAIMRPLDRDHSLRLVVGWTSLRQQTGWKVDLLSDPSTSDLIPTPQIPPITHQTLLKQTQKSIVHITKGENKSRRSKSFVNPPNTGQRATLETSLHGGTSERLK